MILEYEDIKQHIPRLVSDLKKEPREEIEKEKFISYPRGMQEFLCDGVINSATYKRVNKLWNKKGFPRKQIGNIKGVLLSDLLRYENSNS